MVIAAGKYSVVAFSAARLDVSGLIPSDVFGRLVGTNKAFEAALRRLNTIAGGDDGTARLEALMMEVIDVGQHRMDAWLTGHAWMRLRDDRNGAAAEGLRAGYYGFQRGSGQESAASTARPGGYLQAPSQPQAVAAAVMRSAHLRNAGEGAFALNLRSARAARALRLLDHLRKGISLPQALGLQAEAWLRKSENPQYIASLRADFPITDANTEGRAPAAKVIDGPGFVEAVYQRAGGAADVANGWLQVLSGNAVPGRPEFLRNERLGQASDHRVS